MCYFTSFAIPFRTNVVCEEGVYIHVNLSIIHISLLIIGNMELRFTY